MQPGIPGKPQGDPCLPLCTGINCNGGDWKVPTRTNCATASDHLLSSFNKRYLSLPIPRAGGSEPICGKERTLKEPFFSRRSSFTYIPLPILSIAQFLPLCLAFKLSRFSLVTMKRVFFYGVCVCMWEGGRGGGCCCGDSSGLSLLWEESRFFWHQWAGIGGEGGGVWDRKRHSPQTPPLNGWALLCIAAVSCPTAGLHLQPQQARLPHLLRPEMRPHTQGWQHCF